MRSPTKNCIKTTLFADAPICQSQLVDQPIGVTAQESISINGRVSFFCNFFGLIPRYRSNILDLKIQNSLFWKALTTL